MAWLFITIQKTSYYFFSDTDPISDGFPLPQQTEKSGTHLSFLPVKRRSVASLRIGIFAKESLTEPAVTGLQTTIPYCYETV